MKHVMLFLVAGLILGLGFLLIPAIEQDPTYHDFFDKSVRFGIPHFGNVVSNASFLLVALLGLGALRRPTSFRDDWERVAYGVVLAGSTLVAAGSAYYHWHPTNHTLFWDRLPMTFVFMALLAATLGDRVKPALGRASLAPLLVAGVLSVCYWRASGDLRLYALAQFGSILAMVVLCTLRPSLYTGGWRMWAMLGLYGLAKLLEMQDHEVGALLATGGHPLKHLAAAGALGIYVDWVGRRREELAMAAIRRVLEHPIGATW